MDNNITNYLLGGVIILLIISWLILFSLINQVEENLKNTIVSNNDAISSTMQGMINPITIRQMIEDIATAIIKDSPDPTTSAPI